MAPEGTVAEVEVNQDPLAEAQSANDEPTEQTEEGLEGADETESESPKVAQPKAQQIALEQVQKHPVFQEIQSKVDRVLNVNKTLTNQISTMQATLAKFRQQEKETYIQQYGDTPEVRANLDRLYSLDDREAQVSAREANLAPIQKAQTCSELMTENSIPEEYRAELMEAETLDKMEERAKVLKSVLSKFPKMVSKPKAGQSQRQPALSHIPDKASGSVAPRSVEGLQESYIGGKITYEVYAKEMAKLGKPQY